MIPEELKDVLWSDPERMGGTVCFLGTRVPVEFLIEHVEAGLSIEDFLKGYGNVPREAAVAVLSWLGSQVRASFDLATAS